MKIHVFNPEHDLALAFNKDQFTPPHAARELRFRLGFLPALWADESDVVLVDDADFAQRACRKLHRRMAGVSFQEDVDLRSFLEHYGSSDVECSVWGWDLPVRKRLIKSGVNENVLPSHDQIQSIKVLSGRQTAVRLLAQLTDGHETVGQSVVCSSLLDIFQFISHWKHVVLKAPWSCSGRGIKYVNGTLSNSQLGWCKRVLEQQGSVIAELYYNKVLDFGMEFQAHADGTVSYKGLSVFQTRNGAYMGNLLAREDDKMQMLDRYFQRNILHDVREKLICCLSAYARGIYTGPLGVDMMVVPQEKGHGYLLHPCVEVNWRRTMGHVALSLTPAPLEPKQVMRVSNDTSDVLRLTVMEHEMINLK